MSRHPLRIVLAWAGLMASAWSASPACPEAADIEPQMLMGRWQIEWVGDARPPDDGPWLLELGPHPEYPGSLKGALSRSPRYHPVVADWDDETLTVEESEDGVHIAATWQASVAQGQCGRVLQGVRFTGTEAGAAAQRFRMRQVGERPGAR